MTSPDFKTAIEWVVAEIKGGRNDTVHDFLAYLAEQMIEMNKAKNEESKGFLKMARTGNWRRD